MRDGFVMGEGAGVLILEELTMAERRWARIYAEVCGYGMTGDSYHITSPSPEGVGAARCMNVTLNDAGLSPDDVSYINAHGTSTKFNDENESSAIKTVFGKKAYDIPVSPNKSRVFSVDVALSNSFGFGGTNACILFRKFTG